MRYRFYTSFAVVDNRHTQRRHTLLLLWSSISKKTRMRTLRVQRPSTLWKIVRKDLGLATHKMQLAQELNSTDRQTRHTFGERTWNEITTVTDFQNKMLFSDKTHIWLDEYIYKRNSHIWSLNRSDDNPQAIAKMPKYSQKTPFSGLCRGNY